jgi:hypothetical protein
MSDNKSSNNNYEIILHVLQAISNVERNEEALEEKAKIFSLCLDIPQEQVKEILIDMDYKKEA